MSHQDEWDFADWVERLEAQDEARREVRSIRPPIVRPRVEPSPNSKPEGLRDEHELRGDLRSLAEEIRQFQLRELQPLAEAELDARIKLRRDARGTAATERSFLLEVFATAAEACRRGMDWEELYLHQLETGLALLDGRLVELPNGDGKTAAAVLPFVYRVLAGGKGYLFTANPFLAERDAGNYGLVYHQLGLSVGVATAWGYFVFDPVAAYFSRELRRALGRLLGVNYGMIDRADVEERVEEVVDSIAMAALHDRAFGEHIGRALACLRKIEGLATSDRSTSDSSADPPSWSATDVSDVIRALAALDGVEASALFHRLLRAVRMLPPSELLSYLERELDAERTSLVRAVLTAVERCCLSGDVSKGLPEVVALLALLNADVSEVGARALRAATARDMSALAAEAAWELVGWAADLNPQVFQPLVPDLLELAARAGYRVPVDAGDAEDPFGDPCRPGNRETPGAEAIVRDVASVLRNRLRDHGVPPVSPGPLGEHAVAALGAVEAAAVDSEQLGEFVHFLVALPQIDLQPLVSAAIESFRLVDPRTVDTQELVPVLQRLESCGDVDLGSLVDMIVARLADGGLSRLASCEQLLASAVCRDDELPRLAVVALETVPLGELDRQGFQTLLGCLAKLSGTPPLAVLKRRKESKEAYACDVVYGDCTTPIFDYLRTARAASPQAYFEFDLDFAILDEVDFVLLDKGRRPVILARTDDRYESDISRLLPLLGDPSRFREDVHFRMSKGSVRLLEAGVREIENVLDRQHLYDPATQRGVIPLVHRMLHARTSLKREEDYIVDGDRIIPLDHLTYRPSGGAYSTDGTQQMLEYRERLRTSRHATARESETTASIMPHNYFRLFRRLAGMSGTVKVEESRFTHFLPNEVYVLRRPRTRTSTEHVFHATLEDSIAAVVGEVRHAGRRPVLVITPTIELSRRVHAALTETMPNWRRVALLNAENYREEEQMTLRAGQPASVLVTTPMLGRGADIPLTPEARAAGGLLVLSLGRQFLRRLEQQVEGRCGRRGDPGQCVFHTSWEDETLRRKVPERLRKMQQSLLAGGSAESGFLGAMITKLQRQTEKAQFASARNEFVLDRSIHHHRLAFYALRKAVLLGDAECYREYFHVMLDNLLVRNQALHPQRVSRRRIRSPKYRRLLLAALEPAGSWWGEAALSAETFPCGESLLAFLHEQLAHALHGQLDGENGLQSLRGSMLGTLDDEWIAHLARMDHLRNKVFIGNAPGNAAVALFQREAERFESILVVEIETKLLRLLAV